jgi:hypothetical protein
MKPIVKVACGVCGKIFDVSRSEYKRRMRDSKSKSLFCSYACAGRNVSKILRAKYELADN